MKICSILQTVSILILLCTVSCQFRIISDSFSLDNDEKSSDLAKQPMNESVGSEGLASCLANQISKFIEGLAQSKEVSFNQSDLKDLSSLIVNLDQKGVKRDLLEVLSICLEKRINPTESFVSTANVQSLDERNLEDTSLSYSEEVAKKFEKVYGEGIPPVIYQQNQTPQKQNANIDNEQEEFNRDPAPDLVYVVFESIAAHAGQLPPTSLRSCLNGMSGRIILNFMLDIIGELHDGGYERVRPTAIAFDNVLPESTKNCLSNDANFINIKNVYEIHETSLPDFYEKVTRLGLSRDFMKLRMTCRRILISADMEDFEGVGENAGKLLNLVFSPDKMTHYV